MLVATMTAFTFTRCEDVPAAYEIPGGGNGGSTTEVPTGDIATENGSPESSNISDQQDSEDVFNKGWFSDPDAYPQVALWLFIEFLIIMGAWQIAKRFRNRAIGVAVGFVPAVVTLYFIFQNVNRLLPPNL